MPPLLLPHLLSDVRWGWSHSDYAPRDGKYGNLNPDAAFAAVDMAYLVSLGVSLPFRQAMRGNILILALWLCCRTPSREPTRLFLAAGDSVEVMEY